MFLCLYAELLAAHQSVQANDPDLTAFVGVHVIPMDSERVLPNQTVLIRDRWFTEPDLQAKLERFGKQVRLPRSGAGT